MSVLLLSWSGFGLGVSHQQAKPLALFGNTEPDSSKSGSFFDFESAQDSIFVESM
jgi:hypothetical protein